MFASNGEATEPCGVPIAVSFHSPSSSTPAFAGEVALVTGGTRGVGAAITTMLTQNGVRVAAGEADGLASQLELPVRGDGKLLGRFVLSMPADGSGLGLPAEDRALAVA